MWIPYWTPDFYTMNHHPDNNRPSNWSDVNSIARMHTICQFFCCCCVCKSTSVEFFFFSPNRKITIFIRLTNTYFKIYLYFSLAQCLLNLLISKPFINWLWICSLNSDVSYPCVTLICHWFSIFCMRFFFFFRHDICTLNCWINEIRIAALKCTVISIRFFFKFNVNC